MTSLTATSQPLSSLSSQVSSTHHTFHLPRVQRQLLSSLTTVSHDQSATMSTSINQRHRQHHDHRHHLHLWSLAAVLLTIASLASCERNYDGFCPDKCVCFHFSASSDEKPVNVWVNCEQRQPSTANGYRTLPPKLPDETYAIDLTFNNISNFAITDTIPSLKLLRLSTNNLQSIESNAFDNLYNLQAVYLSYNNLSKLDSATFSKLIRLTVLDLSHNRLNNLPRDIFSKNFVLTELILSHNPLINLFPEWFESLGHLEKLDLSYNQLYSIRPETFHGLTKLKQLDLSGNLFTHVPNEGLRTLTGLTSLKLNVNQFKYLNEESFRSLSNLVVLEICTNELLSKIESRTFSELINLQNLTIADNNALVFIHETAFKRKNGDRNYSKLSLDLKRNHLTNLSGDMLPFCQLQSLDLRKNPWNCDCSMSWIIECDNVVGDPRCMNPPKLHSEPIHSIAKSEFTCSHENGSPHSVNGHIGSTGDVVNHNSDVKTVKVLILLMAATLLLVLGLSIAVVLKRSDLMKSNVRRGNGSIYYVKAHSAPGYANDVPTGSLI